MWAEPLRLGDVAVFRSLRLRPGRWSALFAAIAIAAALIAALIPADAHAVSGSERPNVVVLMTDDQEMSTMSAMPKTRRLVGDQGVSFDRYYAAWPLCCPARTTYLTGQFAHNHGVHGNLPPNGGYAALEGEDNTLPVWLQKAGYRTIHVGKYLNGYGIHRSATVPPGWSSWHGAVDWSTYRMWGYTLNNNGTFRRYGSFRDEDPRLYQTDVYSRIAEREIRRSAREDSPFYLNVAYNTPHFEFPLGDETATRPAPRDRGAFGSAPLPDDPSINEADISDKPLLWQYAATRLSPTDLEEITARYRGTLASLLAVDRSVARLLKTLRETGELDNTYFIYTTDNGYFYGHHQFPRTKYFLYEPSSHLPLLMRGPGLPRGAQTQELTQDVDMAATIAEIADARPGRLLDGRSMLPFARHPGLRTDRAVIFDVVQGILGRNNLDFDMDGPDSTPDVVSSPTARLTAILNDPTQLVREGDQTNPRTISGGPGQRIAPGLHGLRTDRWAYWEWDTGATPLGPTEVELYDMVNDPYQLENRAMDPDYLRTRLALAGALERMRDCDGPECQDEIGSIPGPESD